MLLKELPININSAIPGTGTLRSLRLFALTLRTLRLFALTLRSPRLFNLTLRSLRLKCILSIFFLWSFTAISQDLTYARKVVDTLSSDFMQGRGYVNKGDSLAADYIKNEFEKSGLKSFPKGYYQAFDININTFPDTISLSIGKKNLIPGQEFMISSSSPSLKGTFKTFIIDSTNAASVEGFKKILLMDLSTRIVVIDAKGIYDKDILNLLNIIRSDNVLKSKGLVYLSDKNPIWGLAESSEVNAWVTVSMQRQAFVKKVKKISIEVKNKFIKNYSTANVISYLEGKINPDSFIVFTAHYDHLGKMGAEVMFPGANDNASGVAMLLNLAKHYSKPENTPDYSIAFIATAAEELGLLGADYYAKNRLFPLKQIRFLINLDMVGTGDDGIKVVNATVFEKEFGLLDSINKQDTLLKAIAKRSEAAISDHYPFYAKGVKCFYIYTLGGISEYHNQKDIYATLPFTEYSDLFRLITGFVKALEYPTF